MPTQRGSRGKPSSATTYRSTSAAPKQQEFSNRRRTVKTYGRSRPAANLKQETLTQMNFTSSIMREYVDLVDDDEEKEGEEEEEANDGEEDDENDEETTMVELKSLKSAKRTKAKDKSRSSRRKTTGDKRDGEENPRRSKRRKTLGDSPVPTASSSFHTQTLTQMMSTNDRDALWQIDDSQDDEDAKFTVETPKKGSACHLKAEPQEGIGSAVPSLVQSATPVNRQRKMEIPSSQSPATPMLLRYSPAPQNSPLLAKSSIAAAPSSILKKPQKTPRSEIIPHSNSTAGESTTPTPSSAAKMTPSKQLRFNLPDDKENVTPGRTKPKSPKPKSQLSGRRPLREVPDSDDEPDEDLDETESETESEDDTNSGNEPDSPTPKRFRAAPPVKSSGSVVDLSKAARSPSPKRAVSEENPDLNQNTDPTLGEEVEAEMSESSEAEIDNEADHSSPSQNFMYTQGLESQRLSLESIHALGPQNPHSDIMVSLHPEHIARIVNRTKTHEFRAWKIPDPVSRVWIYITRPESQLKYMCIFGEPKTPGEIQDERGIGNADFNRGQNLTKFAYEILQVYELNNPVSLEEMKIKGWVAGAPQKFTYIPPAVVGELTANLRCALFEDMSHSEDIIPADITISQELKEQLQRDADHSTQRFSDGVDEVIPASQTPRKNNTNSDVVGGKEASVKPALSKVPSTISNHESPSLPNQRLRSFVRSSQATTVSQVSSSPAITPSKAARHPILISSPSRNSSPTVLRRTYSSLQQSSSFATRSQLLPDSLLIDDIQAPPPIVWDSADEDSD